MSFLGDAFGFDKYALKDMWKGIKKNPERMLLGAADPWSTKMWNKALGKDWEPLIDQMGGPYGGHTLSAFGNKDGGVYARAERDGVDTKHGGQMHDAAHVIAALFSGGYGLGALSGGGASAGAAGGAGGGLGAGAGGMAGAASGSGAAGLEGVTVLGSSGGIMSPGTAAALEAAAVSAAGASGANPSSSQSNFNWRKMLDNMPTGNQQQQEQQPLGPTQQRPATGARPASFLDKVKAGLGQTGERMFPIDQAYGLDQEQQKRMRQNALMQMGLGMMGAASGGAGFGEAASFGLGRAQHDLTGALQRGYENARESRQEQRQTERDKATDDRFDKQYERQVAHEDRIDERDQRNFDRQLKQDELSQGRFESQQKVQADQFERRMRLAEAKANGVKVQPPSGYQWKADGSLEPIGGGPADPSNKTGNYQEAERTAAFLGTRLANAMTTLKDIPAEDQKPGLMESAARELGSEMSANMLRTENRQKANAAQRDALDAALTLATGAAYTKEQIDALRVSYFPQIGDTPETQAQKKQSFEMLLQAARVKAGRASTAIDQALGRGATGSWTIEEEK